MVPEPCPTCGRPFETERGMRVHHAHGHDEKLPNRRCAVCGTDFYSEHEKRYCSDDCRQSIDRSGGNAPNYQSATETTDCNRCGTEFEYYPSEKPGQFCTECVAQNDWQEPPSLAGPDNPNYTGGKRTLTCDACGDPFERYPSNIGDGATLCSNECRATWFADAYTGSGHPNWQGGPTGPYGPGWARVRKQALERDGYRCRYCGTTAEDLGRNPDVHHIVPVRRFVEEPATIRADAHTLDNVIALCPPCHRRADTGTISQATLRTPPTSQTR